MVVLSNKFSPSRRNISSPRGSGRKEGRANMSRALHSLLVLSAVCLFVTCLAPLILMELMHAERSVESETQRSFSVHNVVHRPGGTIREKATRLISLANHNLIEATKKKKRIPTRVTKDGRTIADLTLKNLSPDVGFVDKPVARGVAGRPLDETPSILGSKRSQIECDINVDSMAYWNDDPPSKEASPFSAQRNSKKEKFLVFTPDIGGWNNIRMSLEIIFVIAAATGRTLVLPPPQGLYLLQLDKKNPYRSFADFYPLDKLQKRVKTMSVADFLNHPDAPAVPANMNATLLHEISTGCIVRNKDPRSCFRIYDYLAATGTLVNVTAMRDCMIFDEEIYSGRDENDVNNDLIEQARIKQWCGLRKVVYWKAEEYDPPDVLFFNSGSEANRVLTHFYVMLHFTNPRLDNYYKRFVRDYLRYKDSIYCAAGKIVKAVQAEALMLDSAARVDDEGAGAFSSLHVRRGDLQYKEVKISAAEWYSNTHDVWRPNEILYVATDERNKTFFNDLAIHHELRYLDDYWELAGLGDLDPNYMGMIDTIVASRSRTFAGTWFSTFSACITRLRGYHGMSMFDTWYSYLPKKTAMHTWQVNSNWYYAYEEPDGWIGIDTDVWPTRDAF